MGVLQWNRSGPPPHMEAPAFAVGCQPVLDFLKACGSKTSWAKPVWSLFYCVRKINVLSVDCQQRWTVVSNPVQSSWQPFVTVLIVNGLFS